MQNYPVISAEGYFSLSEHYHTKKISFSYYIELTIKRQLFPVASADSCERPLGASIKIQVITIHKIQIRNFASDLCVCVVLA